MQRFHKDDRVVAVKPVAGNKSLIGKTGTVIFCSPNRIGVRFDHRFIGGHDCQGRCPNGFGRYGVPNEFELLSENDGTEFDESETLNQFLMDVGVKAI